MDSEGNPVTYEIRTESTPVKDEFIFYVNGKAFTTDFDPEGMFYVSGSKANREAHMTIENQIQMKLPETGSSTNDVADDWSSDIRSGSNVLYEKEKM